MLVAKLAYTRRRRIQYGSRKSRRFRSESTASGTGKHLFSSGRRRANAPIRRRRHKGHTSPSRAVMNCYTAMPLTALCGAAERCQLVYEEPCNRIARETRGPPAIGPATIVAADVVHEFYSSLRGSEDSSSNRASFYPGTDEGIVTADAAENHQRIICRWIGA